ncbi:MAG: lipopolysaccharide biosynthesis protein [Microthrixaceae bacterium]
MVHRGLRSRRYVRNITDDLPIDSPDLGLRRTALPLAVLRVAGQGGEFLAVVLLARNLGPGAFGVLSVGFLVARYGGLVADWGASIRGSRDVAARAGTGALRGYVRWRALVGVGLAVLFGAVAAAVEPATAVLAVCVLARGLNRDWWSLGHGRGARAGVPAVVQGGGLLVAVVALAPDEVAPAATIIAVAFGAAALVSVALNRLPAGGSAAGSDGTKPAATGWVPDRSLVDPWILIVSLADQVLATADTLLLALLGSTAEAGVYAAVYRLPNAWLTVLGLVVAGLVPGVTGAVAADPAAARRLRRRILRVGAVAGLSVLAVVPVAVWAVPLLFGEAYRSGQVPAALLLLGIGVATVTAGLLPLVLALGRDKPFAGGLCAVAALNVAANLLLIPRFGPTGAASVTLGSQVLVAGLYLVLSDPRPRAHDGASAPRS